MSEGRDGGFGEYGQYRSRGGFRDRGEYGYSEGGKSGMYGRSSTGNGRRSQYSQFGGSYGAYREPGEYGGAHYGYGERGQGGTYGRSHRYGGASEYTQYRRSRGAGYGGRSEYER